MVKHKRIKLEEEKNNCKQKGKETAANQLPALRICEWESGIKFKFISLKFSHSIQYFCHLTVIMNRKIIIGLTLCQLNFDNSNVRSIAGVLDIEMRRGNQRNNLTEPTN